MKIVISTRFLLKGKLEGFGWFTYEIFRRVVAQHPEHEFIFLFDRPFDESFIFEKNVRGEVLFPPARHPLLFMWWYEWAVPRALARLKADVFVSPDGYLSLRTPVPTLMVVHDVAFKHFPQHLNFSARHYLNYFTPKFLKKAKRLATVSEYSKKDLVELYGTPADKIDVIYNASDERFHPLPQHEQEAVRAKYAGGKDYFLYVGSVHPRKNLPRLLKAFDAFKEKNAAPQVLLLAGRMAWQTGEVGEALQAMRHRDAVIFLDYVPTPELPKLMASAFAVTYVSLFEGFGMPILEAMCCDAPVICSNTSSMPEVAADAALLVDPYDIASIEAGMTRLFVEIGLRASLIEKGRRRRTHFSWDESAKIMWKNILEL